MEELLNTFNSKRALCKIIFITLCNIILYGGGVIKIRMKKGLSNSGNVLKAEESTLLMA